MRARARGRVMAMVRVRVSEAVPLEDTRGTALVAAALGLIRVGVG